MSNNFDLKKYLVENKLTTNSKMLTENEVTNYVDDLVDIMSSGAGKATGLTMLKSNVKNITGELKAKGLLDAVSKELTDYINTTEGFTFQDIEALEQHGYDMSGVDRSNLYDADKMMNEGEESKKPSIKVLRNLYYFDKLGSVAAKEDIDEKYHKDSDLIFKKGTTVKDDTKHDDSEYEMIIKSKRLKKGTDYKMLTESEEGKHSKMMKESKAVKKVTAGGITYKVGDDDPEDEGIIMYIDKHKNGYFITGGTFRDPHDYAEGEEPNEGYGYAIDFEGNRIDEDDLD
jgi:hypothetical protein